MKKKLSILLASALIFSSTATSFGASFADINDVPWSGAETYINAASSLGLMAGEESKGKAIFRSNDSVSLCETEQIVYNLLKETKNVSVSNDVVSKWTEVMSDSNIPSWAHTAVAYCLENSIVSTSSVLGFMDKDGKSKEASREEVAVMLGKALCLVDPSLSLGSTSTKFKDNTKISSSAEQYIKLLSDKHILSGDNNGNFNPKKTINRTEMAVLITKSYTVIEQRAAEALPAEGTAHAFVSEISTNAGNVTVTFFNGMPSRNYTIDSTVPISYEDGKGASYKDIAMGQLLTISYNGDYITNVVIGKTATDSLKMTANKGDVISGMINIITPRSICILDRGVWYNFDEDGVNVTLDGKSTNVDDLKDALDYVYKGNTDYNYILYADLTMDENNYVTDIVVTKNILGFGTISNITTSKINLRYGDPYYFDNSSVDVILDNAVVDVDDLIDSIKHGNKIFALLIIDSDDYIIQIEAITENEHEGTISYFTSNKIMLTDGNYYYYDNDYEDVAIGKDVDELIDAVNNGDKIDVELKIDGHGFVTEIWANIYVKNEGTISCIDREKGIIELTDGRKYYFEYEDDDIDVICDSELAGVDDLIDAVNKGDTIYAELITDSNEYIAKIYATTSH